MNEKVRIVPGRAHLISNALPVVAPLTRFGRSSVFDLGCVAASIPDAGIACLRPAAGKSCARPPSAIIPVLCALTTVAILSAMTIPLASEDEISGRNLYGDNFSADQIREWYDSEVTGYFDLLSQHYKAMDADNKYNYEYDVLNLISRDRPL
jgi:hypothetical protein